MDFEVHQNLEQGVTAALKYLRLFRSTELAPLKTEVLDHTMFTSPLSSKNSPRLMAASRLPMSHHSWTSHISRISSDGIVTSVYPAELKTPD